jgi:hypothetical protein
LDVYVVGTGTRLGGHLDIALDRRDEQGKVIPTADKEGYGLWHKKYAEGEKKRESALWGESLLQRQDFSPQAIQQMAKEGKVVQIPTDAETEQAIRDWIEDTYGTPEKMKEDRPGFDWIRNNCADFVTDALNKGGCLGYYVSPWPWNQGPGPVKEAIKKQTELREAIKTCILIFVLSQSN